MPIILLVRPIIFDSEPDALLQPRELEPLEQAPQPLVPHALARLAISLGRVEDDLPVRKLRSYRSGQIRDRVLLSWHQRERLATLQQLL